MLGSAYSWREAANHPRTAVAWMSLTGLVAGGLIGYFRYGDSIVYGIVLGLGVALILGTVTWRTVHDPNRVQELEQRQRSASARGAAIRLTLPFLALGLAVAAGALFDSVSVSIITFAVALAAALVLRRFIPR